MLLSRTCVNAIRASLEIAAITSHNDRSYVPVKTVADSIGISHHFLGKISQTLIEAGILRSFRGPNGGVGLVKAADEVFLIDIIEATDGVGVFEQCLLGLPECSNENPCPLHRLWGRSRDGLLKELRKESLASILKKRPHQKKRGR